MTAFLWLLALLVGLWAALYCGAAVPMAWSTRRGLAVLPAALLALVIGSLRLGQPLLTLAAGGVAIVLSAVVLRRESRNRDQARKAVRRCATHLTLLTGSFVFLIPFAWLISTALKTDEEMAVFPPVWIPTQQVLSREVKTKDGQPAGLSTLKDSGREVAEVEQLESGEVKVRDLASGAEQVVGRSALTKKRHVAPRWQNFPDALRYLPAETHYGLTFLANTLFLVIMGLIGTLLSSSLVAFSFARLRWPGRDAWFVVLLATMMVPGAVTMMPQFLIFRNLGWIDTLAPLWVPAFFGSAFNIFLLRQFFLSIPGELEDAARLDGCGPLLIYWRVMLPLVKPALAAISIMTILASWNNFMGPLIYLSSAEKMPLAYALQLYQQQHGGEPGLLMAASTFVVLPIILLFFVGQKWFIEGASLTGLGGR
ncbi:MAG: carbohydrate ABC transporter permease [Armatimonadetes bacterium]|nr:carbohydrate ABC transporter permease [Armatimonadota bacterium]